MKNFLKHTGILALSSLALVGCGSSSDKPADMDHANMQDHGMQGEMPKDGQKPPQGGMGGMMKPSEPTPMTEEQNKEAEAGKADHAPTTLTFHVDGGSFFYTPNMITVKKGDTVKIIFQNVGGMHNFMLDEFNIKMDPIKTGESKEVEFVADKAGTFEYYCGVGSHRQMGQKGQLIVTE